MLRLPQWGLRICCNRSLASVRHAGRTAATSQEQDPLAKPSAAGGLLAFYNDHIQVDLPPTHRFPMLKYSLVRQRLQEDAALQGMIEFRPAPPATAEELAMVHTPGYTQNVFNGRLTERQVRGIGFPWSQQLVLRSTTSTGGTLAATRALLEWRLQMTCMVAGGTHHAFADSGEAFCVFNDIAVAAAAAMQEYGLDRLLVIDCDVHQGNGTADIFEGDARVTTFDMHGDRNYPWKTRRRSTYDVPLPDGTGDDAYLSELQRWLPLLFERHQPQIVFFQAGVDALQGDSLGRLAMTCEGLQQRNAMVYNACTRANVPVVITMGGGYSRPIQPTVAAHADVYKQAALHLVAQQQG